MGGDPSIVDMLQRGPGRAHATHFFPHNSGLGEISPRPRQADGDVSNQAVTGEESSEGTMTCCHCQHASQLTHWQNESRIDAADRQTDRQTHTETERDRERYSCGWR